MVLKNKTLFSRIRNQHNAITLFIALFANLMAFSEPLHYALFKNSYSFISQSSYSGTIAESNYNNEPVTKVKKDTTYQTIVNNKIVANVLGLDGNVILAIEKQGIIGKSENLPIDELTDNIFSFELKQEIKKDKDAYLEYELFGLADGSQATKSINDQLATGGSIIKTTKDWTKVREKLNPHDLQKGKNNIKFTTSENSKYQYMVRNLKMVYEEKSKESAIVFNQSSANSYGGKIAFSGYVTDLTIQKVTVLGNEFPVIQSAFEVLVDEKEPNANLEVSYTNAAGVVKQSNIKIKQLLEKPTEVHKSIKTFAFANKLFVKAKRNSLVFGGAKLVVDTLSVNENKNISITGLRYVDLPTLSPEMVNVTAEYSGYKMLPHGKHFDDSKPAKVYLKYDETKLPTGYTAKDIKTFYFDTDQKKWMALEKDTLLINNKEVVSKTNHFTDFINGIIKVPESPETGSYTPTSIKDIKAADPTAGVVSISPPSPNNMGTVNTSFPIKLPAGRSGMQPSLSVNYNSEGGNGWMGLGWDMSIPGVSLDTRWGAPRYGDVNGDGVDDEKETEIYSMGGGMLTLKDGTEYTNPHRKDNIARNSNDKRQFYPRIEGSYAKVIRHGTNPTEYWWEVTDKMGNKSFYGGYGTTVNDNAVIRTKNSSTGNISYWALYRTEDTNGNYVEYTYHNIYGLDLAGKPGHGGNEFYIKEIKYALHKTATSPNYYKVEFLKDNDSGQAAINRADVQVSARNGVIQVTKNLLKEVKIGLFQDGVLNPIRSYRFDYNEHAFFKQQLERISEYDASGDLFYSNTMEYVDKGDDGNTVTNSSFIRNSSFTNWNSTDDSIDSGLILLNDKPSILGSSRGHGFNVGGTVGVGLGFDVWTKLATVGLNYTRSWSFDDGIISFQDINGDGLPDKIMRRGSKISYRPNNGISFGNEIQINTLSKFAASKSNSDSFGVEANIGLFAGYTRNLSESTTDVYISDVNGDGLIDVVDKGTVKFSSIDTASSTPVIFGENSAITTNPIVGGVINSTIVTDLGLKTLQQLNEENPLHDAVKMWTAPKTGYVVITGNATLSPLTIPSNDDPYLLDYDGVKLSIQKNTQTFPSSNSQLIDLASGGTFVNLIPQVVSGNFVLPATKSVNSLTEIYVTKGDRLYFRVQSRAEGSYDRVVWNPSINYTGATQLDANGLSYFSSNSNEGFIMSSDAPYIIPSPATINAINGCDLSLIQFSDDLVFEIERGTINDSGNYTLNASTDIYRATYNHITGSGSNINLSSFKNSNSNTISIPGSISSNTIFKFRVTSSSNVDWKAINWQPVIQFTPASGDLVSINAVVNYAIYNQKVNPVISKFSGFNNTPIVVKPIINSTSFTSSLPIGGHSIKLVVKNNNKRVIGTRDIFITKSGTTITIAPFANLEISNFITSDIFVEFYSNNIVANAISSTGIQAVIYQSAIATPTQPIYNTPTGSCTSNRLTKVSLNTLNDAGLTCLPYYDNRITLNNPNLINATGTSYSINITLASSGYCAYWIDFDRDGIVDSNEFKSVLGSANQNIPITIPANALDGLTRMRIRGGSIIPYGTSTFNNNNISGTVRDYMVNIISQKGISTDMYCIKGGTIFGPDYRNWGQFGYNGGVQTVAGTTTDFGNLRIDESVLNQPEPTAAGSTTNPFSGCNSPDCYADTADSSASGIGDPFKARFIRMYPNPDADPDNYAGLDKENFVEQDAFSPSRFGVNDLNMVYTPVNLTPPVVGVGSCSSNSVPGIPIVSKGKGNSYAGGGGFGAFSGSGSYSDSKNRVLNSYQDMNGDSFPDMVTKDNIQYTNAIGTLKETIPLSFGDVSSGKSESLGATASGTFNISKTKGKDASLIIIYDACGGIADVVYTPATQTQVHAAASLNGSAGGGKSSEDKLWMDMNGDGLPDRVSTGSTLMVELNLGYGFDTARSWAGAGTGIGGENKNFGGGAGFSLFNNSIGGGVNTSISNAFSKENLSDINGDGLPDFIKSNDNGGDVKYHLNKGNGFDTTSYSINAEFINSNKSAGEGANLAVTVGFTLYGVKFSVGIKGGADQSLNKVETSITDINGDGYPDLLKAEDNENLSANLSQIGTTNLLKKVNTPTGGSWEVEYARVGNTYELPKSKYVMSTIKTFDAFTADNIWSPDRAVTTIEYQNPHHDRREREFFGFEKVKVNQHPSYNDEDATSSIAQIYRYSVQEFHNRNYYLKGALKKESLFDANGALWTENSTTYGIYKPDTVITSAETAPVGGTFGTTTYNLSGFNVNNVKYGSGVTYITANNGFLCTSLDNSRLFVTPLVTVKYFTEGGAGLKTMVTLMESFDAKGNITQYRDYGEQNTDVYVSKIVYFASVGSLDNAVGFPSKLEVLDTTGTLQRERKSVYDNEGNLKSVITKLNGSENAEVKMTYDSYGNIKRVSHENSINPNSTVNNGKFFRDYFYDEVLHTYPTRVEDAFGYFSTSVYNYLFGIPVYTTDMNLQPMRTRIDDRGRVIDITGPYELFVEGLTGGAEKGWTVRFEYNDEVAVATKLANATIDDNNYTKVYAANKSFAAINPGQAIPTNRINKALTRHFDPEYRGGVTSVLTTNQILTATLTDGFGKPIQVKKMFSRHLAATAGNTPNATNNKLEWLLPGKVKTDGFGRTIESYYPTTQPDTFNFAGTSGLSAVPTNTFVYDNGNDTTTPTLTGEYDILDRSHSIQSPGETNKTIIVYSIDSNRFKTIVTNELGQVQRSYTDIRGRTTQTVQESITGDITTSFEYNNISELKTVTDVAGNKTESKYDQAGRRIEFLHPDNGITKFTYDKSSNLIKRETSNLIAAGQSIKYKYTYNRLDEINYDQNPENNVHYYYGTAGNSDAANDNAVGRLWYHVDASGTQYFEYGKLGELIKNRRSVAVAGDRAYWFQTEWTYDTWNRVKSIKYPDQELVTYKYNQGGELHAMTSSKNGVNGKDIISQLGYDKFGQRTYLRYGNGTETTYDYESERRRLAHMKVQSNTVYAAATNRTFIDNKYLYDAISNVKSIENNLVMMPTATQIGGRSKHEYTYDDLNRLVTATGYFVGRNENGIDYSHNRQTLEMKYDSQHNIIAKTQVHEITTSPSEILALNWTAVEKTNYKLDYKDYNTANYTIGGYSYTQPHAPRTILDNPNPNGTECLEKTKAYSYDANGNQTITTQKVCVGTTEVADTIRENLWDEEDRLKAIDLNPESSNGHAIAIYTYDAGGERIIKQNTTDLIVYENAQKLGTITKNDFMLYPSGMLVARPAADGSGALSYTKHYFAGSQRVSSKIGTTTNLGRFLEEWTLESNGTAATPINPVLTSNEQIVKAQTQVFRVHTAFNISDSPTFNPNTAFVPVGSFEGATIENEQYYFHPDHLGSSNYITNSLGEVSQHIEYFAFGETFVEEHKNSHNSPYKFNGKELDEESDLYYYGARYFDPRISIWISVDPLVYDGTFFSGKHNGGFYNNLNQNSYIYCYQNPINLIDPNGKQTETETVYGGEIEGIVVVAKRPGFSWSSFGRGIFKGVVCLAIAAAVVVVVVATGGAAAIVAGATSALGAGTVATIATVASVAGVGIGVGIIGKAGVEAVTGKEMFSGKKLSNKQTSENLGKALVEGPAAIVGGAMGLLNTPSTAVNATCEAIEVAETATATQTVVKGGGTALAEYYPKNGGALGKLESEFLMPGTQIDRFGSGFGKYFSPRNTPMDMRALPGGNTGAYNAFEVIKPFEVQSSTIAPAFGKIGFGKQYLSPVNMNTLLKRGIIAPIR